MIDIHALGQLAVQVHDALGVDTVPVPLIAGGQMEEQAFSPLGCRGGEVLAEPVVGIMAAEGGVGVPGFPPVLGGHAAFGLVTGGAVLEAIQHHGGGTAQSIQLFTDHTDFILLIIHIDFPFFRQRNRNLSLRSVDS